MNVVQIRHVVAKGLGTSVQGENKDTKKLNRGAVQNDDEKWALPEQGDPALPALPAKLA